MRKLSEAEVLTLNGILKMETDALAVAKATHMLIADNDLKKLSEAGLLSMEGRIRGLQQFINENKVIGMGEVH